MRTLPKLSLLALLTTYLVWGSTYLALQIALVSFPPFFLMGSRFCVAGALLFAWLKYRGVPNPSLREWRDALIVGTLLLGGGMGLTALGEQTVSSGLTAVFIASAPLMLALFAGLFGQWPSRREWLGIAVGFSGVALLASGNDFTAHPAGVLAVLGAVACWSLGSVLAQNKMMLAPGPMGFASEMLMGGLSLLLIAQLRGENFAVHANAPALYAWAYLVVAGSLAAFSAYMYLLSRVSNALASSYAYVNPLIAVVLGAVFASESIGARETLAMLIILGSVVVLTTTKKSGSPDANTVLPGETS
ncbi:MAG TPA: drug/metabolite exporter YedA [Burkholderiaceae bacterium]|jgi:drug/metabolite transporter (DMT)-like permease|nr:drug/metabolite exporter YedA [Burkholderiaceae bacterium]